jgi:hypothetical protein
MRAAYSYTRFSSAGQKGNSSTDRQLEAGRDWYNHHIAPLGIPLDETFTDSARSAYKGEHVGKKGDLGRFLAAIQSGAVAKGSILIAENLDRISRQGAKIGRKLLEQVVDEGVEVHIVNVSKKLTYGWENRQEDSIVVDAELGRAFKESERKSVIIKAGLAKVKHADDWCGVLPFWLQKVDENGKRIKASDGYDIVEIPEQAALVRDIFRLAAQGLGSKRIMQALKEQGIKCSIALGTVGELLRNRAVLGEHQPLQYLETGTVADGDPVRKFPRIIDQTQFDLVAARLDGKKKICADGKVRPATGSHSSHQANNLFEGLLHDVTEQPERSLQFQAKGGANNPHLISAWEADRKSNRIRYDLFEKTFLSYLTDADWKAIAGEKETEALRQGRHELNLVKSELDQVSRLLDRRSEQAKNPDLPDAVVAEYYTQMADARSRIATLTEQQYRLEGLISLESARSAALETPEKLIAMITAGDPTMRLSLRAELRRMISKIEFDFKTKPEKIRIKVTFLNDVSRETELREPVTFTKPLHPARRVRASSPMVTSS